MSASGKEQGAAVAMQILHGDASGRRTTNDARESVSTCPGCQKTVVHYAIPLNSAEEVLPPACAASTRHCAQRVHH